MSGLASLAMAIDRLDQQQSSPTTVQTSFVDTFVPTTTKPHQQPVAAPSHSWVSSTARIPQKQSFQQTARVVSVGSTETTDGQQVYTNTPVAVVAPPKMNSSPKESDELVIDNPTENPPPSPPSPDDVIDVVQDDDVLCGELYSLFALSFIAPSAPRPIHGSRIDNSFSLISLTNSCYRTRRRNKQSCW